MPPWLRRIRRQADTAYLMFAATVTGLAGLAIPASKSQAIMTSLPGWVQVVWYSGILVGGLLGGIGVLWGGRVGLIVERPARWLLAGLCAAFGVAVFTSAGARGVIGAAFIGLFGVACVARAHEIRKELHHPSGERELHAELESVRADLAALRADLPRPGAVP